METKIKNRGHQGWSLDKGSYLNAKGGRQYRRHWLGQNRNHAETVAKKILADWSVIKANGGDIWSPLALDKIEDYKRAMRRLGQVQPDGESLASDAGNAAGGTLYGSIEDYLQSVEAERQSKQICDKAATYMGYAMGYLQSAMPDRQLSDVGFHEIRSAMNVIVARPPHRNNPTKRISVDTVNNLRREWRRFFKWMSKGGHWSCSAQLDECFLLPGNLHTESELTQKATIPLLTRPELIELWKHMGSDRNRLYFLLALNCGFTQIDIGTLTPSHCFLDAVSKDGKPRPYIERYRHKSMRKRPILGKHRLWPETAYLLNLYRAKPNKYGLMLLNEDGKPLMKQTNTTNTNDNIGDTWIRILKRVNSDIAIGQTKRGKRARRVPCSTPRVRSLSFKYLRKTGSNIIRTRKHAGKDASECFLVHADETTGRAYNNADFVRLANALRRARTYLAPMFDAYKLDLPESQTKQPAAVA